MKFRSNDKRHQDELRLEQQSLARGDALEYGALAACRDRNKAAIAAAKAELEQASEALRTEPSEENTARYMRAVKRMQELREERRKLWGTVS
jgi:hypothetical protein